MGFEITDHYMSTLRTNCSYGVKFLVFVAFLCCLSIKNTSQLLFDLGTLNLYHFFSGTSAPASPRLDPWLSQEKFPFSHGRNLATSAGLLVAEAGGGSRLSGRELGGVSPWACWPEEDLSWKPWSCGL